MQTASTLVRRTKKRPRQADLRRAVSTAYYAMFHALCEVCADNFIGTDSPERCERAWRQTYRAINHRFAQTACQKCVDPNYAFPLGIVNFASYFRTMQETRHSADYDPTANFNKADVEAKIYSAQRAIDDLSAVDRRHKGAFAAMMLFKQR